MEEIRNLGRLESPRQRLRLFVSFLVMPGWLACGNAFGKVARRDGPGRPCRRRYPRVTHPGRRLAVLARASPGWDEP